LFFFNFLFLFTYRSRKTRRSPINVDGDLSDGEDDENLYGRIKFPTSADSLSPASMGSSFNVDSSSVANTPSSSSPMAPTELQKEVANYLPGFSLFPYENAGNDGTNNADKDEDQASEADSEAYSDVESDT